MLRFIENTSEVLSFAVSFLKNSEFADPNHESEEDFRESFDSYLAKREEYCTFGIYNHDKLIGVFAFLMLKEEKYLEMLVGVSSDKEAYCQMFEYLENTFKGWNSFFVYNPKNYLLNEMLVQKGAKFDTAQIKMDLKKELDISVSEKVVAYDEQYKEGYKAIHLDEEHYWTADKVLARPDKFHIFLALEQSEVVGYIDMEHSYDVNEPFELFVCPSKRRKGYGRALLEAAIVTNRPKGMMLHVDIDNIPAIQLYTSLGFERDEFGGSVVGRLRI